MFTKVEPTQIPAALLSHTQQTQEFANKIVAMADEVGSVFVADATVRLFAEPSLDYSTDAVEIPYRLRQAVRQHLSRLQSPVTLELLDTIENKGEPTETRTLYAKVIPRQTRERKVEAEVAGAGAETPLAEE